jgi:hypothetical protein
MAASRPPPRTWVRPVVLTVVIVLAVLGLMGWAFVFWLSMNMSAWASNK